jgi:hypothetical protein
LKIDEVKISGDKSRPVVDFQCIIGTDYKSAPAGENSVEVEFERILSSDCKSLIGEVTNPRQRGINPDQLREIGIENEQDWLITRITTILTLERSNVYRTMRMIIDTTPAGVTFYYRTSIFY